MKCVRLLLGLLVVSASLAWHTTPALACQPQRESRVEYAPDATLVLVAQVVARASESSLTLTPLETLRGSLYGETIAVGTDLGYAIGDVGTWYIEQGPSGPYVSHCGFTHAGTPTDSERNALLPLSSAQSAVRQAELAAERSQLMAALEERAHDEGTLRRAGWEQVRAGDPDGVLLAHQATREAGYRTTLQAYFEALYAGDPNAILILTN